MATPRYRVIDTKGAYLAPNPEPQLLALGADHSAAAVYNIRAPVYQLLPEGAEFDFSGIPGPHLAPLNDEAREAMAGYWKQHPNATLDPTRHMPLGQDPFGGKSVEQLVTGLLNEMDRERADAAAGGGAQTAQFAALAESQLRTQEALAGLIAALGTALVPTVVPTTRGRAA